MVGMLPVGGPSPCCITAADSSNTVTIQMTVHRRGTLPIDATLWSVRSGHHNHHPCPQPHSHTPSKPHGGMRCIRTKYYCSSSEELGVDIIGPTPHYPIARLALLFLQRAPAS